MDHGHSGNKRSSQPGCHRLHVFPYQGHQGTLMEEDVSTNIFPRLLGFLPEHAHD